MGIYLVFAGDNYYPQGGWHDFIGCYPTLELAIEVAKAGKSDWWHIVSGANIVATN